jgi:hypothetical protein
MAAPEGPHRSDAALSHRGAADATPQERTRQRSIFRHIAEV